MSALSRLDGLFCLCACLRAYIVCLAFMSLITIYLGLFVYGISQTKRWHESKYVCTCGYMCLYYTAVYILYRLVNVIIYCVKTVITVLNPMAVLALTLTNILKEGEPGHCIKVFKPVCTLNIAERRGRLCVCVCGGGSPACAWKVIIDAHQQWSLIHATTPAPPSSVSWIICCDTLFWCCAVWPCGAPSI